MTVPGSAVVDAKRSRGRIWPVLIVSLLVAHVGLMVSFAVIASSDPSFGVEPNYYEQALEWDKTRALMREPGEDGYAVTTALSPTGPGRGELVVVLGRGDEPVSGATLSAIAFHAARAGDRQRVELTPRGPGTYGAELAVARDGSWEVRYELTTAERTYRFARRLTVRGSVP